MSQELSNVTARAPEDVALAYRAIKRKRDRYGLLWQYYEGNPPLYYSTERLKEMFRDIHVRFSENWCAVVVDSAIERLNLAALSVSQNDEATERLQSLYMRTELSLDSADAHLAALVCGEAFIIAWRENDGVEAYYNDPRNCHIQYDTEKPREKRWAAKLWRDDEGHFRLTMYYADRLEYYRSRQKMDSRETEPQWEPTDPGVADNPYGIIPVFHLRRDRRTVASEITNVLPLQDAVNKLFSDMMVAAEFGAFPQRYIISQQDPGRQANAPNVIWNLPGSDGQGQPTSAGQFAATDLQNYLRAMDNLAHSIAIITRTPKHYFWGQTGVPSGEALVALEAPLNKKVLRYQERLEATWRRLGAFLLRLDGIEGIDPMDVLLQWDAIETVQPLTRSQIREADVRAGIPLLTALRDEGKDQAWIDQMLEDAEEERGREATLGETILRNFETQFGGGV